jgi:hemoglobin
MAFFLRTLLLVATTFVLTGCATQSAVPEASLYQRLGGEAGVREWVDELITISASDSRTSRSFQKVDMKRLKSKIAEHVCSLAGGGCKYTGDTMKDSHNGLKITEAEFYAMVDILRGVLDRRVGEREKNELLKILAPMKHEIVTA